MNIERQGHTSGWIEKRKASNDLWWNTHNNNPLSRELIRSGSFLFRVAFAKLVTVKGSLKLSACLRRTNWNDMSLKRELSQLVTYQVLQRERKDVCSFKENSVSLVIVYPIRAQCFTDRASLISTHQPCFEFAGGAHPIPTGWNF